MARRWCLCGGGADVEVDDVKGEMCDVIMKWRRGVRGDVS